MLLYVTQGHGSHTIDSVTYDLRPGGLYCLAPDPALWVYIVGVGLAAVLCTPLALRYSRALMLHWFGGVHYQPGRAHQPAPTAHA